MSAAPITFLLTGDVPAEDRVARHIDTVVQQWCEGQTFALVNAETVAEARAWEAALAERGVPCRLSLPDENDAAFRRELFARGIDVVHIYVETAS